MKLIGILVMTLAMAACGGGGGGGSTPAAPTPPAATPPATTPPANNPPANDDAPQEGIIVVSNFTEVERIQFDENVKVAMADVFHTAGTRDYDSHGDRMIEHFEGYRGQSINAYGGDWTEWKIGDDGFVIKNGSTLAGVAQATEDGNKQVNLSMHSAWTTEKTDDFTDGVYTGALETLEYAAANEVVIVQGTENGVGDCRVHETAGNGHPFQPCGVIADAAFQADTGIQYLFVGFIREDGTRDGYTYDDQVIYYDGAESTSEATQIVGAIFAAWRETADSQYSGLVEEFKSECVQNNVIICQ